MYVIHRPGMEAVFSARAVEFESGSGTRPHQRVTLTFPDGSAGQAAFASPVAGPLLRAQSNYMIGADRARWLTHIRNYGSITYPELFPGVSLKFYGNGRDLEHDFTIAPGADPSSIAFQLRGDSRVRLTPRGDLSLQGKGGSFLLRKPVAYQQVGRKRIPVEASFLLARNGRIGFRVGAYNTAEPLVIDPIFAFSTYLDGSTNDNIASVTTDKTGNLYLTGSTTSLDFPVQNPLQSCSPGEPCEDVFITKLDPSGTKLLYSTYLGGSREDDGAVIRVDSAGNAIVVGTSVSQNFPAAGSLTPASCDINVTCYFIASLKPDGAALNYAGLIGGGDGIDTDVRIVPWPSMPPAMPISPASPMIPTSGSLPEPSLRPLRAIRLTLFLF
jgi:hypothetical protein